MNTTNQIIACVVLVVALIVLYMIYYKRKNKDRKAIKEYNENLKVKKEFYKSLTKEQFEECPDDELVFAVMSHIAEKETHIYDYDEIIEVVDLLTDDEKLLYSLNMLEQSISGKKPNILNFFSEEKYQQYIPFVSDAFIKFNVPELSEVFDAAKELADIVLHNKEDNMTGRFSRYNFTDFTTEINTVMRSSGLVTKACEYIRSHPESFVETDYVIDEYNKKVGKE